jgi:hemerythrin-like domain-containing protein
MKCTDLLLQDHKVILRALDVLQQMAKRVEKHQPLEHDDVEAFLRFLRSFGDDYHQCKEESALFPELRRVLRSPEGPVERMLFEHDQERSLVEAVEDALFTKNGPEFVHFAHRLIDMLRDHIRKEDHILFQMIERSLSSEQDEKIVSEFEKFIFDPASMSEFRKLEWKYMRKVA